MHRDFQLTAGFGKNPRQIGMAGEQKTVRHQLQLRTGPVPMRNGNNVGQMLIQTRFAAKKGKQFRSQSSGPDSHLPVSFRWAQHPPVSMIAVVAALLTGVGNMNFEISQGNHAGRHFGIQTRPGDFWRDFPHPHFLERRFRSTFLVKCTSFCSSTRPPKGRGSKPGRICS